MGYVPAAEVNPTGAQPEVIYSDRPITIIQENQDTIQETFYYLRADKIIGPKKGQIKKGNITSCGFCYNSKYKSFWPSEINADFTFIDNLLKNNDLKVGKLNKVLTSGINLNTIYGQGKREDI